MTDTPRAARLRKRLNYLRRLARVTRKKLLREKHRNDLGHRAWREAAKDLNVREVGGNNTGKDVAKVIRDGGGDPNGKPPWCVYGVVSVLKRAGSTANWGVAGGAVRNLLLVDGVKQRKYGKRGRLVRFTFDHVGLFGDYVALVGGHWRRVSRRKATHIRTREYNTGPTGAVSDSLGGGDGVYEKIRALALVTDYLEVTK